MKTTHTFIVHFWLKKKSVKKDGTIPIYARVRLDGNSKDISTIESILESNWCLLAEKINNKVKNASLTNNVLDDTLSGLKTI
ncbi:Arm DNA-binding domain-containing protein [Allomuricauda sp. F6463D]|uniref:Arm DNA-binding domain-containing protein n=1 Tax=Allomuricauda sp. F6463D TaxID=2926409 RepID=UPI001FF66D71|nr:Arm DNA-binding domain-containing protein [Muricauda sp. F6463D]MCK0160050.1 Arm DNA-binding domain-containing protein [Muricauda sp. F6463D]